MARFFFVNDAKYDIWLENHSWGAKGQAQLVDALTNSKLVDVDVQIANSVFLIPENSNNANDRLLVASMTDLIVSKQLPPTRSRRGLRKSAAIASNFDVVRENPEKYDTFRVSQNECNLVLYNCAREYFDEVRIVEKKSPSTVVLRG